MRALLPSVDLVEHHRRARPVRLLVRRRMRLLVQIPVKEGLSGPRQEEKGQEVKPRNSRGVKGRV